jgi:hypothetical protein
MGPYIHGIIGQDESEILVFTATLFRRGVMTASVSEWNSL